MSNGNQDWFAANAPSSSASSASADSGTDWFAVNAVNPGTFQERKGGPVIDPTAAGQAPGQITADHPITPLPGESFANTMRRAVEAGQQVTPAQIAEEHRQNIRKAPVVAAAAFGAGFAQPAIAAAAGAAFAPTATTETIGTGILDAAGQEFKREVVKYGPSVARQVAQNIGTWVRANPAKAASAAGLAGLGYQLARTAGVPLPDILKSIFKVGKAVVE